MVYNKFGLIIIDKKTKLLQLSPSNKVKSEFVLNINNTAIEKVKSFKYLGSMSNNKIGLNNEINARIQAAVNKHFSSITNLF